MAGSELRVVLLGKTGSGKSSSANTILGRDEFKAECSSSSVTQWCQTGTREIGGRRVTVVDTPGFFDTTLPEEDVRREIVGCVTECAPGPHAFLVVLVVGTYTPEERETVERVQKQFGEEALKFTMVLFTHGKKLKHKSIEQFVQENKQLKGFVQKCGGGCHVFNNKKFCKRKQVMALLRKIENMVRKNRGGHYTNKMLQETEVAIEEEEEHLRQERPDLDPSSIRQQARGRVRKKWLNILAGTLTGAVLGAFLGTVVLPLAALACTGGAVVRAAEELRIKSAAQIVGAGATVIVEAGAVGVAGAGAAGAAGVAGAGAEILGAAGAEAGAAGAAAAGAGAAALGAGITVGVLAMVGLVAGGVIGGQAGAEAETAGGAAKQAAESVMDTAKDIVRGAWELPQTTGSRAKSAGYKQL